MAAQSLRELFPDAFSQSDLLMPSDDELEEEARRKAEEAAREQPSSGMSLSDLLGGGFDLLGRGGNAVFGPNVYNPEAFQRGAEQLAGDFSRGELGNYFSDIGRGTVGGLKNNPELALTALAGPALGAAVTGVRAIPAAVRAVPAAFRFATANPLTTTLGLSLAGKGAQALSGLGGDDDASLAAAEAAVPSAAELTPEQMSMLEQAPTQISPQDIANMVNRGQTITMRGEDSIGSTPGRPGFSKAAPGTAAIADERYKNLLEAAQESALRADPKTRALLAAQDKFKTRTALSLSDRISKAKPATHFEEAKKNWHAINENAKQDTQSAAIAMIKAALKIENPGAVVRVKDYELLTSNPSNLSQRAQDWVSELKGQGKLAPEHKKELIDSIRPFIDSANDEYQEYVGTQLNTYAGQGGDPNDIGTLEPIDFSKQWTPPEGVGERHPGRTLGINLGVKAAGGLGALGLGALGIYKRAALLKMLPSLLRTVTGAAPEVAEALGGATKAGAGTFGRAARAAPAGAEALTSRFTPAVAAEGAWRRPSSVAEELLQQAADNAGKAARKATAPGAAPIIKDAVAPEKVVRDIAPAVEAVKKKIIAAAKGDVRIDPFSGEDTNSLLALLEESLKNAKKGKGKR